MIRGLANPDHGSSIKAKLFFFQKIPSQYKAKKIFKNFKKKISRRSKYEVKFSFFIFES